MRIDSTGRKNPAKHNNISVICESKLCMGCGTCESICPRNAIEIKLDKSKGLYLPVVDAKQCNECGLCLRTCPGAGIDIEAMADEFLDNRFSDLKLGTFDACYTGYSSSEDIRYNSASGGLVTSLLVFALEQKLIDGALVLGMSSSNPLETTPLIATKASNVVSASGSKYCPAAVNRALQQILLSAGRFAVVGLPCHLHAIRKLEMVNESFRKKIVAHLGLFCANNNTYLGTEYFLRLNGIQPDTVRDIRYRAEGWPGKIKVTLLDGSIKIIPRATTEPKWWRKALFSSAFHYDFAIPRCLLCVDQTCELADISFGDPWLEKYKKSESLGRSFIIVRNRLGYELLNRAQASGAIIVQDMPINEANMAQNYAFKDNVGSRIVLHRMIYFAAPSYGKRNLPVTLTGLLSAIRYLPSYISYKRWIWPCLKFFSLVHYLGRMLLSKLRKMLRTCLSRLGIKRRARP